MPRLDTRTYYDRFSERYDAPRHRGYHWMIDTLESEIVAPYAAGRRTLELGCGTGLLLDRLRGTCQDLVGVDISSGMLSKAHLRGHRVVQASVEALPFGDESFDVVYSFKVLAHVERIQEALAEATRVLRPGGVFVGDFYNKWSLRRLAKAVAPPGKIARGTHEGHVYTRFDTPGSVEAILPPGLRPIRWFGVRVMTPWWGVLELPGATPIVTALERVAGRARLLWRFGGFLVLVAEKEMG